MKFRYLSGWLVLATVFIIVLSIGCEKGGLGVRPGVVRGRVVERANSSIGVPGALVRMISSDEFGDSALQQSLNFQTTRTDEDGYFAFTNVRPDNLVFEVSKSGFAKAVFPDTGGEGDDQTVDIDHLSLKSGDVLDIGEVPLIRVATDLPDEIKARIVFRDSVTKDFIDRIKPDMPIGVRFENENHEYSGYFWRQGVKNNLNEPIIVTPGHELEISFRVDSQYYKTPDPITISGTNDIDIEVFLEPVSYGLLLRAVNVPDYIEGDVVNIFVESRANFQGMPQIIGTHTLGNLGDLHGPSLPQLINLPNISLPIDLRIQVRGYRDEVVRIDKYDGDKKVFEDGAQGTYRLDIDFHHESNAFKNRVPDPSDYSDVGGQLIYHPDDENRNRAGLYDNMITRDVVLLISGSAIQQGDLVDGIISLPYKGTVEFNPPHPLGGAAISPQNGGPVRVRFSETATGYRMGYTGTVYTASGSFSASDDLLVNSPSRPGTPAQNTLRVGVEINN